MNSICVFCGSSDSVHPDYLAGACDTGRLLARRGLRLVYGGGKTGLMGAVADGALEAGGEVVGVIIPSMHTVSLAHAGITSMEVTPNMRDRKARMHELSDGFIALPGGYGTFDELFEAITWAQTGAHKKPIGLLNLRNYYAPLLAAIDHAVAEGFVFREHRNSLSCESEPEKLLDALSKYEHNHEAVKRWMRE